MKNRSTSHVFEQLAIKRGEQRKIVAAIDAAHRRLSPIKRCHPWRAKAFAKPPTT